MALARLQLIMPRLCEPRRRARHFTAVHGSQLSAAKLRHRYMALRHGQSTANVAGIVSSNPAVATVDHGLTELGREQAAGAVGALAAGLTWGGGRGGPTHVVVYSSDFTRAWETAEIFCAGLREEWAATGKLVIGPCREPRLRERWFGEFDGGPDALEVHEGSLGGYPAVVSHPHTCAERAKTS